MKLLIIIMSTIFSNFDLYKTAGGNNMSKSMSFWKISHLLPHQNPKRSHLCCPYSGPIFQYFNFIPFRHLHIALDRVHD